MFTWNRSDDLPEERYRVSYGRRWKQRTKQELLYACRTYNRDENKVLERLTAGETVRIGLGYWRMAQPEDPHGR
jgi:hypothetical protein